LTLNYILIIISNNYHYYLGAFMRFSKQRVKILDLVKSTDVHPTADWVYHNLKSEIPNLSLGTVYRNLKLLSDQGIIQRLLLDSSFDRFDGNITPHYHIVCENCGSVGDIFMDHINLINSQAAQKSTYKVTRYQLVFFGICEKCQTIS